MLNKGVSSPGGDFPFEEVFANLRIEFRVDAQDCLGRLEAQLEGVRKNTVAASAALSDLCREVHTLKGSGGSFGFPTVTVIAHRLENYISGISGLDGAAIDDTLVFLDRMRDVLEGDSDDGDDRAAQIVRGLPVRSANRMPDIDGPDLEVLLVPSTPIIGRAVEGEFKLQGCRVTMLASPLEAIALAIRTRPDLVVASAVSRDIGGTDLAAAFRAMKATRKIAFALLTSFPRNHPELRDVSDDVKLIRHDQDLPGEIARLRTEVAKTIAA